MIQGGVRRARMEILRHVVGLEHRHGPSCSKWESAAVRTWPSCRRAGPFMESTSRAPSSKPVATAIPEMAGRLAWAEAENLPFDDATFDACWSVGGFNYYSDHEAALREMRRVTRPGGPVVVADELPGLHRAGLGHLLGIPSLDAWWLRKLGLDREFVEMVLAFDVDLTGLFGQGLARGDAAPDLARAGLLSCRIIPLQSIISSRFNGGFPCRPQARNIDHDLSLEFGLGHLALPQVPGCRCIIDPSHFRPGLLRVREPAADRERHPDRQGPDDRQQPGRPAVLR